MPEDVNRQAAVLFRLVVIVPTNDFETRRQSNEVNEKVEDEISRTN